MRSALLLAMMIAGGASAETYKCETTNLTSPEFRQHTAALLVQGETIVLSNGDTITEMAKIADNITFDVYNLPQSAVALFSVWKTNASLQILHPRSGSAPRMVSYICTR